MSVLKILDMDPNSPNYGKYIPLEIKAKDGRPFTYEDLTEEQKKELQEKIAKVPSLLLFCACALWPQRFLQRELRFQALRHLPLIHLHLLRAEGFLRLVPIQFRNLFF